jgi:hypothetical protein
MTGQRHTALKHFAMGFLGGFIASLLWGYWTDVKTGDWGWFIGKLVLVPMLTGCIGLCRYRSTRGQGE